MKNVFPKVEETILLDVLASENNNVMKTSEKLKSMGYEKKNITASKPSSVDKKSEKDLYNNLTLQKETEIQKPTPPPRMKSLEEKSKSK